MLLSNWCDTRFLGDDGEQHYSLRLDRITKLSVQYNTSGWYCWITLKKDEVVLFLTEGTGGNCKGEIFNLADIGAEKIIKWCIENFSEIYCE